jgi:hypothetical protein
MGVAMRVTKNVLRCHYKFTNVQVRCIVKGYSVIYIVTQAPISLLGSNVVMKNGHLHMQLLTQQALA